MCDGEKATLRKHRLNQRNTVVPPEDSLVKLLDTVTPQECRVEPQLPHWEESRPCCLGLRVTCRTQFPRNVSLENQLHLLPTYKQKQHFIHTSGRE